MANQAHQTVPVSRRGLLVAGLAAGAGLVTGAGLWPEPAGARAGTDPDLPAYEIYHGVRPEDEGDLPAVDRRVAEPEALLRQPRVGRTRLYYEVTRQATPFTFEAEFLRELTVWRNRIGGNVPRVWGGTPSRIYSYGAFVNKPGYHGRGRAFDIASVYFTTRRGTLVKRFDCRFDQWRHRGYTERREIRARYWALAASLHHRFRHVLTYLYDGAHQKHIHVDNAVYGRYQDALFDPAASAQVQHVQACCRYVWDLPTTITDRWDNRTRRHSTLVLRRIGVAEGTLVDSNENWRRFNHATLLQGTGRQRF